MIVADSDVLIDGLRGRDPWRRRIAGELAAGRLATTTISVFELSSGVRAGDEPERRRVEALLAAMAILPLDAAAATDAAAIRRLLESKGQPLATADYLIAGICRSRSAVLLTRNRQHFERVPGLILGS